MACRDRRARDGRWLGREVDDQLAYVGSWGFDPEQVSRPVLLVHGGQDRVVPSSHGRWLARHVPPAELWLRPDEGHISIPCSSASALDWIVNHGS